MSDEKIMGGNIIYENGQWTALVTDGERIVEQSLAGYGATRAHAESLLRRRIRFLSGRRRGHHEAFFPWLREHNEWADRVFGPAADESSEPPESLVYFIQCGDHGPVKIGFTRSLGARIGQLQRDQSERLRVLAATPGTFQTERTTHARFAHLRIDGEWFRPEPELLAHIASFSHAE